MAYPVVGNQEGDNMNDPKAYNWRQWAAVDRHGRLVQKRFAREDDAALRAAWVAKYRPHDLYASVAVYDVPRRQGPGWRPLYFVLAHDDLEHLRRAALSACYFLFDFLEIAPDGLDIVYDGEKCFLADLEDRVRNPRLFEDVTLHREDEHRTNRGPQGPENQMRTGL